MSRVKDNSQLSDLFEQSLPFDDPVPTEPESKVRKLTITTTESLEMEKSKPGNAIYLFRRGTFLRAYEQSAWLVSTLFRSDYKLLRDSLRGGEKYVYLGFPYNKIREVFPEGYSVEEHDSHIVVTLENSQLKDIPTYDKWLKESKIIDKKETDLPRESASPISATMHISNAQELALRLATYHMENHTMIENMQFLANLISSIEYKN